MRRLLSKSCTGTALVERDTVGTRCARDEGDQRQPLIGRVSFAYGQKY